MTAPAIEIENLTVRYPDVIALESVSLTIPVGSIVGLVGMNGSGKSSLFSAIMGLVKPAEGSIRLLGENPVRARALGVVAFVPQTELVDWDFPVSVNDVVMMGRYGHLGMTRRPRTVDKTAAAAALARVDLTAVADRQIGQLSGGQRKRTFVARGIAQDAKVLLLDEPFAGVDVRSQATITAVLKELRSEGRSILISTHDLAGIPELCDEVVLLQRRLLFLGTPSEALAPERLALAFQANTTGAVT